MAKTNYNGDHQQQKELVKIPDKARNKLEQIYRFQGTWRGVSATPSQFANIPPGTLCSVYNGYSVPKKWRRYFEMPELVQAEACEECGKLHEVGWCVTKYGQPKKPRTNSKPRRPPWYKLSGVLPDEDRLDKVMKGWV